MKGNRFRNLMPELPEVQTLAGELHRSLSGRRIASAAVRNELIFPPGGVEPIGTIAGRRVESVKRMGKFIRMNLAGETILWVHLGMTGQLLLRPGSAPALTHTHFVLTFDQLPQTLSFRDPRRFGRVALSSSRPEDFPAGVRRLGPEPWKVTSQSFVRLCRRRQARIKSLLLDQTFISGLGNIYADESLHRAGIRPLRRSCKVSRERLKKLLQAMKEVLEEAIRRGGSSIDDYRRLDGSRGGFQQFHRVYGRGGKHCLSCRSEIRTVKFSGRTSAFCPRCQH